MADVLLDSSAIFALLNPNDDHHAKAVAIDESLTKRKVTFILPNFLLAEAHTLLNRRLGPQVARAFLNGALQDYEIERVTMEDEQTAHAILQEVSRTKGLSYFDAVAVAVAERLSIREVFSFDAHFALAGLKLVAS